MKFSKGALKAPFFILRTSGFSLVELMIVVAIIGLLAAVAIPNFQKFQARSKTTEAKLQLAAVYTAEASFYSTYQIYHTCLRYMGYDPTEYKNTRFYAVGFTNPASINAMAYAAAVTLDLDSVDCPSSLSATLDKTYYEAGMGIGSSIATNAFIPATTLGDQSIPGMIYTAGAGGVIFKGFSGATNASAYTINEKKQIITIRNGY
ncbi:MAG: type IV pilin protein [Bacteriovoracaceae bacterium]